MFAVSTRCACLDGEDASVQRDDGDLSELVIISDPAGLDSLNVAVLLIDLVLTPVRPRQHCRHRPREEANAVRDVKFEILQDLRG